MKKSAAFFALFITILLSSCNLGNNSSIDDSGQLKQYIIVRYAGKQIKINDGSCDSYDEPTLKDNTGNELNFKSLTGVINYMTLKGWKMEEMLASPEYKLSSQDGQLIFSKHCSEDELQEIVEKGFIK